MPLSLPVSTPTAHVVWRQADEDLWVATLGGEFAGTLSTDASGRHHVTDQIARPVLSTTSWSAATTALDAPAAAPARRRRRRRGGGRPDGR